MGGFELIQHSNETLVSDITGAGASVTFALGISASCLKLNEATGRSYSYFMLFAAVNYDIVIMK